MYSEAPPYRQPWKAAIYDIADPKCIYICLCTIKISEYRNPVFRKADRFPSPTVPIKLYKIHLIIWPIVCCFRKIAYHIRWIQRLGIMLTLLLIMLTFLNPIRRNGLKMCSPPEYIHITTSLEVYRKPLKYGHLHISTVVPHWSLSIMVTFGMKFLTTKELVTAESSEVGSINRLKQAFISSDNYRWLPNEWDQPNHLQMATTQTKSA